MQQPNEFTSDSEPTIDAQSNPPAGLAKYAQHHKESEQDFRVRNYPKLQHRLSVQSLQLAIFQALTALSVGLLVLTLASPRHYQSLRLSIMALLHTRDNYAVIELPNDRAPVEKLGD